VQPRRVRAWIAPNRIAAHGERSVLAQLAARILPIDAAVARRSAGLHVPSPRPARDALIAATALVHGLTVVTRNTRDFAPMGVPLLNPWLAAGP
jgi:predicted nucleic acid-binding protein